MIWHRREKVETSTRSATIYGGDADILDFVLVAEAGRIFVRLVDYWSVIPPSSLPPITGYDRVSDTDQAVGDSRILGMLVAEKAVAFCSSFS